ncbi:hypothetical protein RintRC_5754 [Richelia intracellularis]|nr:hypothetical protein RintRC_5754 [Richelia intracellularis]
MGLTIGYLLGFNFGFGGAGLWIGQSVGFGLGALFFTWRFHFLMRDQSSQPEIR